MKLSEATAAWEQWRGRQRRRRRLISWGGATGLAAAALGLAFWGGFAPWLTIGEQGEAYSVKLGHPEGENLPLSVSAVPDQALQAVMSALQDPALTSVAETRTVKPQPPAPQPVPQPPQNPGAPASPQPTPPVETPPPEKPAVTERVIRGSEKGNASELILKPQGEKISQNAYWPVYLFMPLPTRLDAGLLAKVQASKLYSALERRDLLLQYYSRSADGLTLSSDPGLDIRPALWEILEGAGYDVANADYKKGRSLRPVVITFQLGVPKSATSNPELLDVKLEQGSGSAAVDEAVVYAFQKSTFANGTGQTAQGRYTYDFQSKR